MEDKIIGRLTLKQFIYLAGTAGLCVVFFSYIPITFAVLLSAPVVGLGIALSFYKVNGKPFIEMLEAGFNYYMGEKLLLWKQAEPTKEESSASAAAASAAEAAAAEMRVSQRGPKLTRGKLAELAWSLDVKSSTNNAPGLES